VRIISADERLAETHLPKILIAGEAGIGKTSLLRTLAPELLKRTLFIDIEAGDLAVKDVRVDALRPEEGESWSWRDLRNLACYMGGPDLSLPADAPYGQEHYDAMVKQYGESIDLAQYDILFIDSITVAARLCLRWAMQQPEAFSEKKGKPDTLGGYGLLGREMMQWLSRLQHTRDKGVIFVALMNSIKDEYGRMTWDIQMDGAKTGRELPGIVDHVIVMGMVPHPLGAEKGEGEPDNVRAFLCTVDADNYVGVTPKDRSGKLDTYERADLGALLEKLGASEATEEQPRQRRRSAG
jgi:DNA polymerase III delta prime subunit